MRQGDVTSEKIEGVAAVCGAMCEVATLDNRREAYGARGGTDLSCPNTKHLREWMGCFLAIILCLKDQ